MQLVYHQNEITEHTAVMLYISFTILHNFLQNRYYLSMLFQYPKICTTADAKRQSFFS